MDTWKHIQLTEEEEENVVCIANPEGDPSSGGVRDSYSIVLTKPATSAPKVGSQRRVFKESVTVEGLEANTPTEAESGATVGPTMENQDVESIQKIMEKRLVRREVPRLVFLMETKRLVVEMDYIKRKIGFSNMMVVDCSKTNGGRSGGLALLWKEDINLQLHSVSENHISMQCLDLDNQPYFLTAVITATK
ncbi:hypothetical protein SESBI_14169 [Sesbania bispinosa]|nr:hypothetical protein SESBI_14169 [Sesbania bispinosa]